MTLQSFLQECKEKSDKTTPVKKGECIPTIGFHDASGLWRGVYPVTPKSKSQAKQDAEFIAFSRNNFDKLVRIVEVMEKSLILCKSASCAEFGRCLACAAKEALSEAERIAGE